MRFRRHRKQPPLNDVEAIFRESDNAIDQLRDLAGELRVYLRELERSMTEDGRTDTRG